MGSIGINVKLLHGDVDRQRRARMLALGQPGRNSKKCRQAVSSVTVISHWKVKHSFRRESVLLLSKLDFLVQRPYALLCERYSADSVGAVFARPALPALQLSQTVVIFFLKFPHAMSFVSSSSLYAKTSSRSARKNWLAFICLVSTHKSGPRRTIRHPLRTSP